MLKPLESGAILGLYVVPREAYNTGILQVWYFSVYIHFILLHMEFENGLSVSVSDNRPTHHKRYNWKSEGF
jgi:hypothetical protein